MLNEIQINQTLFVLNKILNIYQNGDDKIDEIISICDLISKKRKTPITKNKLNNLCYCCKSPFIKSHSFYKKMCRRCGEINFMKRTPTLNLNNKVCIITGGRIKIGYYTSLIMLRNNCKTIVTTRFAIDALKRYTGEKDYENWKHLLEIYQLDFLSLNQVDKFIEYVKEKYSKIDYLINNAAQTLRRPFEFYKHLQNDHVEDKNNNIKKVFGDFFDYNNENNLLDIKEIKKLLLFKPDRTNLTMKDFFPQGVYDIHGQQMDERPINTWVQEIDEISIHECIEVHLINSIVPFYLISKLKDVMKNENDFSYIINVSSMEGSFSFKNKTPYHVHTNMAKSSLNMITRTCGGDFYDYNIVMVSVDTGWNTNEFPNSQNKETPIDCIDGAARIVDPIFTNNRTFGVFYKDFVVCDW